MPTFTKLHAAVEYVVDHVPGGVLRTQLVKLLYLADRQNKHAHGQTITGCSYVSYHYGPYCDEIITAARELDGVEIEERSGETMSGNAYFLYVSGQYRRSDLIPPLSDDERASLDRAIAEHSTKGLQKLLEDVYSTEEFPSDTKRRLDRPLTVALSIRPQFANTGVLEGKVSSLREAGFLECPRGTPSDFKIVDPHDWHELGLALFALWLVSGGPIAKRRQGVVHQLAERQSLMVLRGLEDANQICVPSLFVPDAGSRPGWCRVPVELKRAWMRAEGLPDPTLDDMSALECVDNHVDHAESLRIWLRTKLIEMPAFGQVATGLPGDGLVLDVPFKGLEVLLGGLSTQGSERELEQLFNAFLALSMAEAAKPLFCETETFLTSPFETEKNAFDALLWNADPNYLVVLETTRETGSEPETKPFAEVMAAVARGLGVPQEAAAANRYHKAKQKLTIAGALCTLQQDVFRYVFIILAPEPEDVSPTIVAALQQDHVHAVWWPTPQRACFFRLQRGELDAIGLRDVFDAYLARTVAEASGWVQPT